MNLPGEEQPIRYERRGGKLVAIVGKEPPPLSEALAAYFRLAPVQQFGAHALGGWCPCCYRCHNSFYGGGLFDGLFGRLL